MRIPKAIQSVIESFEKLPGIGPKSAQRLTFYLLHVPQEQLDRFSDSIQNLRTGTTICSVCKSVDETDPCSICSDSQRDQSVICVVEQPLDVLALEKSGRYKGVYHVLHGKIDPLNNIGPEEIFIGQLIARVRGSKGAKVQMSEGARAQQGTMHDAPMHLSTNTPVLEIILATNPTMEGEATAMYIAKQLKTENVKLKISRIGRGLPIGADIEYADATTLDRAMEGRSQY